MAPPRVFLELARPGNAAMAAAGAAVGALGAAGTALDPASTLLACLCAAAGVSGANALNDARDADIDRSAHPGRPIPRGALAPRQARAFAAVMILAAVGMAAAANAWTLAVAAALAATLLAYELGAKRHLGGHVLVAVAAGGLFVLGGVAALAPPATYDAQSLAAVAGDDRLVAPLVMAALALVLNLARELAKSVEDARHDAATRPTFAVRRGAGAARTLSRLLLAGLVPLAVLPWWLGFFDRVYLVLLVPMLVVVAAAIVVPAAAASQRLLKVAMLLGFVPFVATALI